MKSTLFVARGAIFIVTVHMMASTMADQSLSSASPQIDTDVLSDNSMRTNHVDTYSAVAADSSTHRGANNRYFADLAPRQKVMGLVNAIALLRTKISLIEEMQTAFEPRTSGVPAGQPGQLLPGPALAYGDCRLGILDFEVCRHLGFLGSDPMVAPSSTQSKMLKLLGASSLIASLKQGQVHLQEDADLNAIMGHDLVESAVRALNSCWNAQLFLPAFDARPVQSELMSVAIKHTDEFLFLCAMRAKNIIRSSRSSQYDDAAIWLAWIFSDLAGTEASSIPSDAPNASTLREEEPQSTAEGVDGQPDLQPEEMSSVQRAEGALLGGFLNRLWPSQSQQTTQSQDMELATAPVNVLSALTNSMGARITSVVTNSAQSAVKLVGGEAPSENEVRAAALQQTDKRLDDILSMIPDDINGQF